MHVRRAAENVRHGALRTLPSRRRWAYTDGGFTPARRPPRGRAGRRGRLCRGGGGRAFPGRAGAISGAGACRAASAGDGFRGERNFFRGTQNFFSAGGRGTGWGVPGQGGVRGGPARSRSGGGGGAGPGRGPAAGVRCPGRRDAGTPGSREAGRVGTPGESAPGGRPGAGRIRPGGRTYREPGAFSCWPGPRSPVESWPGRRPAAGRARPPPRPEAGPEQSGRRGGGCGVRPPGRAVRGCGAAIGPPRAGGGSRWGRRGGPGRVFGGGGARGGRIGAL